MGRLTLNVLLSFAQFERELTGERLRDWFDGARRRGLWPHRKPFGYRIEDARLVIEPAEAEVVRRMYKLYRRHGSARIVANRINACGWVNREGRPWTERTIVAALSNRLYCGRHPNPSMPATDCHPAIVDVKSWEATQNLIGRHGRKRSVVKRPPRDAMLKGIIHGPSGHAMLHLPVKGRNGRTYRYYVTANERRYGPGTSPFDRFRADEVEKQVLALVERVMATPDLRSRIADRLTSGQETPAPGRVDAELFGEVRRIVCRVDVHPSHIAVTLLGGAVVDLQLAGEIAETQRTRDRLQSDTQLLDLSSDPRKRIDHRLL